ncbi:MAG: hypothetical protein MUE36_01400 [Acidimicrobiales bacterium]|nr:hypothetical protein [Acidimicrobiales bacterium]
MTTVSVVVIVVAIVGLVVVAMAVQALIATLRSLRETVEDLRRETLPAIAELRATVDTANVELARVDALLDTAEEVSARVDATSKLSWMVLRNPLVKLASVSVATDRMARRLQRAPGDATPAGPGGSDALSAPVAELPPAPGRRNPRPTGGRRRRRAG